MKASAIIIVFLFFVGCDSLSTKDKACVLLKSAHSCIYLYSLDNKEAEGARICMSLHLGLLSLIDTKYDWYVTEIVTKAKNQGGDGLIIPDTSGIPDSERYKLSTKYYQEVRHLIVRSSPLDTLINLQEYYSCPD